MCHGNCTDEHAVFIVSVETAAEEAVRKVVKVAKQYKEINLGDRTGGYFCLKMIYAHGFLIPPKLIDTVTNGKDDKYRELCQEKANRLEANFLVNPEETVSSWQSRDPKNKKYGGAVIGTDYADCNYAFSFSGLPEICDEAATLLTAIKVGYLTEEKAIEIARISRNWLFMKIINVEEVWIDRAISEYIQQQLEKNEPTSQELADVLAVEIIGTEEYEEICAMTFDEALSYAFTLIADAGYEDPEAYLKEKGILQ